MKLLNLIGKIEICFTGNQAERFFRLCKNNQIPIYDLMIFDTNLNQNINYHYKFTTYWFYKKTIEKYADRLSLDFDIRKKDGVVSFICKNNKRLYFLILCFICFLILYYLEGSLWHISISGNYQLSKEQTLDFLEEQNCNIGARLKDIDCNYLEEKLRMEYPFITWVCIKIIGTELEITIKENEYDDFDLRSEERASNLGCAIISKENGILTNMYIRSGISDFSIGDEVSEHDIMMYGKVPIYDIYGNEIIDYTLVIPDGDFQIQKKQVYTNYIDNKEKHIILTGRKKKNPYIILGKIIFTGHHQNYQYDSYINIKTFKQLSLWNQIFLPIYYGNDIEYETCEYYEIKSFNRMLNEISDSYECYKHDLITEGCSILLDENKMEECSNGLKLEAILIINKSLDVMFDVNNY